MDVTKMGDPIMPGNEHYTHIHYAFVDITPELTIDPSNSQDQWDKFVKMSTSAKKITSMGGWAFSTEADTYQRFRDATASPETRKQLARSVADHVIQYNLDGVDFDWEYPGVR
jgi:chitinase